MATNRVQYICGCGYRTKSVEEAERHSDKEDHTLTAGGTIEKDSKR